MPSLIVSEMLEHHSMAQARPSMWDFTGRTRLSVLQNRPLFFSWLSALLG